MNKAKGKGKEAAEKGFSGKRKGAFDDDKTGGGRKRNKQGVLHFFSDDELNAAPRRMDMPDKGQSNSPRVVPKEEMLAQNQLFWVLGLPL